MATKIIYKNGQPIKPFREIEKYSDQNEDLKKNIKRKIAEKTRCEGQILETYNVENMIKDYFDLLSDDQNIGSLEDYLMEGLASRRDRYQAQRDELDQELKTLIRKKK